jgi:two-component system sensor kinase FixL
VQNSPFCIHEIELDGTLSSVNPAGLTMIGLTHESQIRGSAYLSAVSEDDRPRIGELLEQACNGQTSEFEFESPDGQVFQSCFVPLTDGDGRIQRIMGITQDVTEKLRAEQELRESEARYRVMTEHATEAIVVLDVDTGRFVDFNQNACQLYKVSHEQLRQMGPADVSPTLQPGGEPSSTLAMQHIKQATEYDGQVHVFEWTHRNLQGGLIPCEVRLVTMPDQGKRLVRGAITDISDRKRGEAERESFIQQLEQKNAELERFTYTVSHDLKSPLITIKGFLGLLERDLQDDRAESVQEDMAEIASAADRMNRLLDDLLELSRVGRIANPVEGVPLQEVAQEAIDLLDAEITASGTRIEFDSELPVVTGDRVRLLEVFQNLLHNAVKFSADQPQPEVHLGTRQENGETVIYVQDNGIGIPPQYHERVFSLFEQLTPDGVGTGIGLSLVKRIVDVHGGWIRIESDGDGHGTTFCFTLGAGPNAE